MKTQGRWATPLTFISAISLLFSGDKTKRIASILSISGRWIVIQDRPWNRMRCETYGDYRAGRLTYQ
ncbi:hypothetical protein ATN84_20115 [Paramesorhizobium deserti]|uniref:Uncharacterized protein n=1 Tax=Paramesorhizobium deserti TaxID=1494590 RepID=A0A135HP71_9HYPH|nr:hypothetical protein ATN84_20115 [Paramesorhizobium deserti]